MIRKKIFVLGDSISIGYGPYIKCLIPEDWEYDRKRGDEALEDLDRAVGANGGNSYRVLAYLNEESKKQVGYDTLLINCCMHDIRVDRKTGKCEVTKEDYKKNLIAIVNKAKEMAHEVIWVETTPLRDKVHNNREIGFMRYEKDLSEYNQIAEDVMLAHKIKIIPLYGFTERLGENIYCDHVHFVDEVRKLQAAFIVGYLERGIR